MKKLEQKEDTLDDDGEPNGITVIGEAWWIRIYDLSLWGWLVVVVGIETYFSVQH